MEEAINNGFEEGVRGEGVKLVKGNRAQLTSRTFMEECKDGEKFQDI